MRFALVGTLAGIKSTVLLDDDGLYGVGPLHELPRPSG